MADSSPPASPFGWTTFDAVRLPYVQRRDGLTLTATRLVDKYVLCHFPDGYRKRFEFSPTPYFLAPSEAELLSRLCVEVLKSPERFAPTDGAIDLRQLRHFFGLMKRGYPDISISYKMPETEAPPGGYGWMVVRDSMIPFVARDGVTLMPLNVLRGAAQLLTDVTVATVTASPTDIEHLNELCRDSGLTFTFNVGAELVELGHVRRLCSDVHIERLHRNDPAFALNASLRQVNENEQKPEARTAVQQDNNKSMVATNQLGRSTVSDARNCAPSDLRGGGLLQAPPGVGAAALQPLTVPPDGCPPPLIPLDNFKHPGHLERDRGTLRATSSQQIPAAIPAGQPPTELAKKQKRRSNVSRSLTNLRFVANIANVEIVHVDCFRRTITCITRGKMKAKYVLIEAVMRLYFPQCQLRDFIGYLGNELSVKLHVLKKREEQALIRFYGIPTKSLHSNLIIKINDFINRASWLQQKFGAMDVSVSVESRAQTAPVSRRNEGARKALIAAGYGRESTAIVNGGREFGDAKMAASLCQTSFSSPGSKRTFEHLADDHVSRYALNWAGYKHPIASLMPYDQIRMAESGMLHGQSVPGLGEEPALPRKGDTEVPGAPRTNLAAPEGNKKVKLSLEKTIKRIQSKINKEWENQEPSCRLQRFYSPATQMWDQLMASSKQANHERAKDNESASNRNESHTAKIHADNGTGLQGPITNLQGNLNAFSTHHTEKACPQQRPLL